MTLNVASSGATEAAFDTIYLTITPNGSFDDFSLLGCLTTGSFGCFSGNQLDASFEIPAAGLNSTSVTATGLDEPHPLDLLEDDGNTEVQGIITAYSYSSSAATPEPSSLRLTGLAGIVLVGLALGTVKRRIAYQQPASLIALEQAAISVNIAQEEGVKPEEKAARHGPKEVSGPQKRKSEFMKKVLLTAIFLALAPASAFAADGQILINQATVMAAGGFPYTITQSGSYKLSGNLIVTAPTAHGIVIAADDVSLDFNGFAIQGPFVCTGAPVTSCTYGAFITANGIHAGAQTFYGDGANPVTHAQRNTTVINGTVSGFGGYGVVVGAGSHVENMQVRLNGLGGIAADTGSVVKGNRSRANGAFGFATGSGCVVEGNTAFENGEYGFLLYSPSQVIGNAAYTNGLASTTVASGTGPGTSVFINNAF